MNRNRSTNIITDNQRERNIETRFANRMQSIFSAVGQIVNDFYLEIGIYCIGLLNAALVAWSIYTDLLSDNQPLLYAVALGVIALIAVEGLAVYLVGAAAKTNNGWLWFFSVVFAAFFTFAHSYGSEHISHYITWAIPFFVVIGYWARTIKVEAETGQIDKAQLEREELERQRKIEDDERQFRMEQKALDNEAKRTVKVSQVNVSNMSHGKANDKTLETLKPLIVTALGVDKPNITGIATSLGVSRATLYRHLGTLKDQGIVHKNGNGWEVKK